MKVKTSECLIDYLSSKILKQSLLWFESTDLKVLRRRKKIQVSYRRVVETIHWGRVPSNGRYPGVSILTQKTWVKYLLDSDV